MSKTSSPQLKKWITNYVSGRDNDSWYFEVNTKWYTLPTSAAFLNLMLVTF